MAAKPPSDFVDTGGSSGGKKGLKIFLGVGCGLLLLIGLVLTITTVVGGMKCAGAVEDSVKSVVSAATFGGKLQLGKYDEAHALLSPELQKELGKDKLKKTFAPLEEKFSKSSCYMVPALRQQHYNLKFEKSFGTTSEEDAEAIVFYNRGTGKADVVMSLRLRKGEGKEEVKISSIKVGQRDYDVKADGVVHALKRFDNFVKNGRYGLAYPMVQMMKTDVPTFKDLETFVTTKESMLSQGDMSVRSVKHAKPGIARVEVQYTSGAKERWAYFVLNQRQACTMDWLIVDWKFSQKREDAADSAKDIKKDTKKVEPSKEDTSKEDAAKAKEGAKEDKSKDAKPKESDKKEKPKAKAKAKTKG